MTVNKVTTGFVIQEFDVATGKCVKQNFFAADDNTWESPDGETVIAPTNAEDFPLEMIQPKQ